MTSKAAIVFCYDDFVSLERLLPVILQSGFDKIVFAVEKSCEASSLIESLQDERIVLHYSNDRLGKSNAFNLCISDIQEDLVYLISCDIMFEPEIVEKVAGAIDENSCGAITNVSSINHEGLIGRTSKVIWDVRDEVIQHSNAKGEMIHGGEFVVLKREHITSIPSVVNEDELLCLWAQKNGKRLEYLKDLVIFNSVPKTGRDYLDQRRRVIYGHYEVMKMGLSSSTLGFKFKSDFRDFFRILLRTLMHNPDDLLFIPFAVILEFISDLFARVDLKLKRNQLFWKRIESSKIF